jgi:hypothetical protein
MEKRTMAQMDVMPNGQTMQLGQLGDDEPDNVIGLGFALAGCPGTKEGNQVQRWLMLTTDLENQSFPARICRMRPALDPAWAALDFNGFMEQVRKTFVEGKHLYIVANCAYAAQGDVIPLPLPDPAPLPRDPDESPQAFWNVAAISSVGRADDVGLVFTHRMTSRSSREHWVLFDNYQQPTARNPVELRGRLDWKDESVFAKIVDGTKFTATSTYMVAKCAEWTKKEDIQ